MSGGIAGRGTAQESGRRDAPNNGAEDYRAIFEATGDGVIIADMEGNLVDVNPALCRMHGYSREEMLRLYPTEFIHPDYHAVFAEYMVSLNEGNSYRTTALDIRKDGTAFPVEVNGTVFTYRGRPHVLGVVRDITELAQSRELLEQRVEERTRELSILLEISRNVTSTLRLQPLLDLILDQLKVVVDYSGAGIFVVEGEEAHIVGFRSPHGHGAVPQAHFRIPARSGALSLRNLPRPTIIDDVRRDSPLALEFREVLGNSLDTYYTFVRSWMAVPMSVKDRIIGYVHLAYDEPGFYTAHHADLALAIAQQAAIAIENARLYEKAQEAAVLEERQRLSRELHDSVSQALYGIGVGAQTTRILLEQDPSRARESNDYVLDLAEAGLAEMRALIFELRPESLETEGIAAALRKQADAVQARHRVPVETALCDEPVASLSVKEALYRIAQEALQNAVKHARPTRAELRLECIDGDLLLEIWDDGAGFDTTGVFPGHLGLHSMRERATRLGGILELESAPGRGTRVRARIPLHSGD